MVLLVKSLMITLFENNSSGQLLEEKKSSGMSNQFCA
jgi:hypothetical protein